MRGDKFKEELDRITQRAIQNAQAEIAKAFDEWLAALAPAPQTVAGDEGWEEALITTPLEALDEIVEASWPGDDAVDRIKRLARRARNAALAPQPAPQTVAADDLRRAIKDVLTLYQSESQDFIKHPGPYADRILALLSPQPAPEDSAARAMRKALEKCRDKFLHYEQLHRLKCTADGDEKADRNREMADMCEAALRGDGGK